MTTEQMDWNDNRRIQAKQPELFEIVRRTVKSSDQRDGTVYNTERLGVYSSELAAYRGLAKLSPNLSVQPLKIDA